MRGFGRFYALAAVCVAALFFVAAAASSPTDTTYSATQTVAVPPASSFTGSAGGDGWAVTLSNDRVFNVFHHNSVMTVNCRLQSNAQLCWSPRTVFDAQGYSYQTSGHPDPIYDAATGNLYIYGTSDQNQAAGVVCFDTTAPDTNQNPFCGFTPLSAAHDDPNFIGFSTVGTPFQIGTKIYAFNYVPGSAAVGAKNAMMCFDLSTKAACSGQPYNVGINWGTNGTAATNGPSPSDSAIGSELIVPINVNGVGPEIACFDASTNAACTGSFPIKGAAANFTYPASIGGAYPLMNASGTVTGFCFPSGQDPCFTLAGAPTSTPSGMTAAIGQSDSWNGPSVSIGSRVYIPNGFYAGDQGAVECYDYSTGSGCAGFPKTFPGLFFLYTVNADPQRPTCLWVNADSGSSQIQNFDAYTGGSCGSGVTRVLTSQFIVPQQACYPSTYQSLQVVSPAPGTYTSGTVQFADGGGNPISSIPAVSLDSNGVADLSGLNLSTVNGLPQYLISLTGASTQQLQVKLTWTAQYDPACNGPQTVVTPKATTLTASLSDGTSTAASLRVDPGTTVTASSTLSGDNSAGAGGTTTYTWYDDAACTDVVATGASVDLPIGTYDLVASYSGDPGNDASSTSCGDNVLTVRNPDTTPPVTTSDAPTGWQNHDLTVTLSATDDLSGVATTYYTVDGGSQQTGTSIALGAGVHTITYWSVDNAGNVETATTKTVEIDETAPVTTDNAPSGWQNHDVTVTLSPTDDASGVDTTFFTVDGGSMQTGTSIGLSEGVHTIEYWSVDNAGNFEVPQTATVKIDETSPTLSPSVSPNPVAVGSSATASPGAADSLSGIASSSCGSVSTATAGVFTVTCTATDNAGNTASATTSYTVYTPLGSGTNECTGIVGGSGGSLDVPAGANCVVLPGTSVSGDVTVGKGSSLTCSGATFGHDLHVDHAASVTLSFCTVVHDLFIVGVSGSVSVTHSSIGHDMHVTNNNGRIEIGNDTVGHDLQVDNNNGGGIVAGNSAAHDLSIQNNSGGLTVGSGNTAGHSLTVRKNS